MTDSNKLTITNLEKIAKHFDLTEYIVLATWTYDKEYTIGIRHRSVHGRRYTFVLNREGYDRGGEWHYSTSIVGMSSMCGTVGRRFLKDPANLAKHILVSIGSIRK